MAETKSQCDALLAQAQEEAKRVTQAAFEQLEELTTQRDQITGQLGALRELLGNLSSGPGNAAVRPAGQQGGGQQAAKPTPPAGGQQQRTAQQQGGRPQSGGNPQRPGEKKIVDLEEPAKQG
jgi:hypothetical protein